MFSLLECLFYVFVTVSGIHGAEKYKPLGCYKNQERSPLLNDFHQTYTTLTTRFCVDTCAQNKYPFAGVQNGNECRCGHDFPSEIIRTTIEECKLPCVGNATETCGGTLKIFAYETGISTEKTIPARFYVGCFIDDVQEFRVLKGTVENFENNSPDVCHKFCYKSGFRFMGLTYHKECWCGDTIPLMEEVVSDSECNTKCSGDTKEDCGGGWRLSIYSTGITNIPDFGRYVGCYRSLADNKVVDVKNLVILTKSNSNRRCLNICDQRGFKYSTTTNQTYCYCSNQLPAASFSDSESNCNADKCVLDGTQSCGGKQTFKLYRTRNADNLLNRDPKYLGCYKDQLKFRLLDGTKEVFTNINTPTICIELCKNRGFYFAGVEYGNECFCSHMQPSIYAKAEDDGQCNVPCSGNNADVCGGPLRVSVFEVGIPIPRIVPASWYNGCYRDDDVNNRVLKATWNEIDNNSPDVCHKHCLKEGYLYFGLTWIRECFCGDDTPSDEVLLDEIECQKQCGGDSTKKCGGSWRTSIYHTGLPNYVAYDKLLGCFENDKDSLLYEYSADFVRSNTPQRCLNVCDQLGYLFAGLERGVECHCGNTQPAADPVDETKCNTNCPGDKSQTCGKRGFMKVYRTTRTELEQVSTITGTAVNPSKCGYTDTIVNGERPCKGDLLFHDTFNKFNESKWSFTVKLAVEPDNEFVTYTPSREIVYVKNGNLYIKPKIQTNTFVKGSVTIAGCTGESGSDECKQKAVSFNILPPVASGQITTRNSFGFRYGVVQVKARLPEGDWMVPEIWLLPKDSAYGADYTSGQVRIAMARGNKNLVCDNQELGNKNLETGIYVGTPNDVKTKIFKKQLDKRWSSKYHNYTVIWAPDNISFLVDNETIGTILNSTATDVRTATGQPSNALYVWNTGTKIAPFDKDFYIVIGMSVGGIRDFPDKCTSNGKNKPWSNTSPKAELNFWETRDNWTSTWVGEKAALVVEHIKVYAL